jgi:hypothetical protein
MKEVPIIPIEERMPREIDPKLKKIREKYILLGE